MLFENSLFSKSLDYKKVVLDFGTYYALENYIIIEVNEGVHFDTEKLTTLIESLRLHYGTHKTLACISNRVNSYSNDPVIWRFFDVEDCILVAACIISYRETTLFNANIEKQMASIPLKRAFCLDEAIDWVQQLKEFN